MYFWILSDKPIFFWIIKRYRLWLFWDCWLRCQIVSNMKHETAMRDITEFILCQKASPTLVCNKYSTLLYFVTNGSWWLELDSGKMLVILNHGSHKQLEIICLALHKIARIFSFHSLIPKFSEESVIIRNYSWISY